MGGYNQKGEFFFTADIKHVFLRYKALYVNKVYNDGQNKKYKS
jgi:hypothetical protein